jgi:transposase, IS30 family
MGTRYRQLGIEERCEIARLCAAGRSIRQIASALDRQPSTIAREIRRNRSRQTGYQAVYAEQQSRARRWSGSKLDRDGKLREEVLQYLRSGWSPEIVAERLKRECGTRVVSYETIYRFIYAQITRTNDYAWRHYLPRAKCKRGRYRTKGGSPASFIALRCPVSERPRSATARRFPGHWEADLMCFRKYGQALLFLHERQTRLLIAVRPRTKEADVIAQAVKEILAPLPQVWRQTVTFDNGTEFAYHFELHDIDTQTYFCDAHAPWQKGGIENAIGRMRRLLPRKTDLATITADEFTRLIQRYNNTPRKCLDYLTPAEVFWNQLLHFKCESTPQLSLG